MKQPVILAGVLLACTLAAVPATATDDPAMVSWRRVADGVLYAYPERTARTGDSLFNPDNRVARLPAMAANAELRGQLELAGDMLRLYLRPVAVLRQTGMSAGDDLQEAYLSQWQARWRPAGSLSFSAGRELLNWGPGQFRSPSSPFYFNNGRTNPMRELSGVDDVKISWTPDAAGSLLLARVTGSGHGVEGDDPWRDSWLAKGELRGAVWSGGLVLADISHKQVFAGAYGQWSLDDAWLLYAEGGSGTLHQRLDSPAESTLPWTVVEEPPRSGSLLLGLTWTLENGQSLGAEYLWYGHGYSGNEAGAYFARARVAADLPPAQMGQSLGRALAAAPDLLRRNYLHLIWQNSLLAGEDYWRLMYSHNLDDRSGELAVYAEHPLNGRLSCFVLGVINSGGASQEFGMIIGHSLLAGLRLAFP